MRYVIAIENRDTVPNQFLEPDSVKWAERELPVTGEGRDDVYGVARDLQRDGDLITAEINWSDPQAEQMVDEGYMACTIFARKVVETHDIINGQWVNRHIKSCEVMAIYITMGVPWVGKSIEELR